MIRIKIFNFEISNFSKGNDLKSAYALDASKRIYTYDQIQKIVNDFLDSINGQFISITPVPVTTHQHNNGRSDTVYMNYTIVYDSED